MFTIAYQSYQSLTCLLVWHKFAIRVRWMMQYAIMEVCWGSQGFFISLLLSNSFELANILFHKFKAWRLCCYRSASHFSTIFEHNATFIYFLCFSSLALVGSLTIGATFLFSPISGILVDKLGLQKTTLIGGVLTTAGMFLSAYYVNDPFEPKNVTILCLTYGLMFGTGAALAYTPTLAILGHYFKRYLGIVSGFVTAGSSVFTAIMPMSLTYIEEQYGLKRCLQTLTFLSSFIILFAIIYKPLQPLPPTKEKKIGRSQFYNVARSLINFDNWKKKKYIIWAISIPIALFGKTFCHFL